MATSPDGDGTMGERESALKFQSGPEFMRPCGDLGLKVLKPSSASLPPKFRNWRSTLTSSIHFWFTESLFMLTMC